jgi:hypothetical protein
MNKFGYVWVQVDAAKDARVYVDGTLRVDHVPAKLLLSEGTHTVEVRKDGVKYAQNPREVAVAANSPAKPVELVFAAAQ